PKCCLSSSVLPDNWRKILSHTAKPKRA
ncbi:hypothetical protein BVZ79_00600B, partial [Haemophilus influenzae]